MKDFLYWLSLTMIFADLIFIFLALSKKFLRNKNFRMILSILTALTVISLGIEHELGFIEFPDISLYLLIASVMSFISCYLDFDIAS